TRIERARFTRQRFTIGLFGFAELSGSAQDRAIVRPRARSGFEGDRARHRGDRPFVTAFAIGNERENLMRIGSAAFGQNRCREADCADGIAGCEQRVEFAGALTWGVAPAAPEPSISLFERVCETSGIAEWRGFDLTPQSRP